MHSVCVLYTHARALARLNPDRKARNDTRGRTALLRFIARGDAVQEVLRIIVEDFA